MDHGSNLALRDREREVLSLLPGRRVKEVAATLGLSVHGVRFHLRKLFTKLRVSNRTELLRRATELGLISNEFLTRSPQRPAARFSGHCTSDFSIRFPAISTLGDWNAERL